MDGIEGQECSGFKDIHRFLNHLQYKTVASSALINWLWQFGRGKPRLGGLTVKETTERKNAARDERLKRGWETRRRRKADKA